MIRMYDENTLMMWTRGQVDVQLLLPGRRLPMGYCDGSDEDEATLREMAEGEGVDNLKIHKRVLKTGRQIWTLGEPPEAVHEDED